MKIKAGLCIALAVGALMFSGCGQTKSQTMEKIKACDSIGRR